jgi:hypothetical protein
MILKHLGVSCAHLHPLPLDTSRPTVNLVSGRIPGRSFVERHLPRVVCEKDEPLMTPVEVPVYFFLAYLTMFVYSNVIL